MANNIFLSPTQSDPLINPDVAEMYRKAIAQQQFAQQQAQAQQPDIWNEIEREIESLTDEQKESLMKNEDYQDKQNELQIVYQRILNNLMKPYILNDPAGKKALDEQLSCVKTVKKKVIKETNKKSELVNEYLEKYSDKSWTEFLAMKQKQQG